MRLSDLPKRESIGTQHITLTEFNFGDGYVCETGAAALVSASVHVFPNADVGESVTKLHTIFTIVESWDIQDEDELLKVIRQEELTGVLSSQPYWPGVTRATTNRGQSRHDGHQSLGFVHLQEFYVDRDDSFERRRIHRVRSAGYSLFRHPTL